MLTKILSFSKDNSEVSWFRKYLDIREQCFRVNNEDSDYLNVICGVPQGNIFGFLLFIIYINDLPDYLTNCKLELYVNDTLLMCAHQDVEEIKKSPEDDLFSASVWFRHNKLHLNVKKTNWSVFGSR